jgi:predicted glycosyltransferase
LRIWIDLANSPHVPLFRALAPEFEARGHTVLFTARDFAQTVPMARQAGLDFELIGGYGGRRLSGKAGNLLQRLSALRAWARAHRPDLALSHNSYSQIAAAATIGIKSVTLMDYEHQPANHLAFRFASRVIVPRAFPESQLKRFGAGRRRVKRYDGIKEDIYLADFEEDPDFAVTLEQLGVRKEHILVVIRPPARDALYHRFENPVFQRLLESLASREDVKVIMLPRSNDPSIAKEYPGFIIPTEVLDGSNLIAAADMIISAGGTMNREAAALGVPAATNYAGKSAAIDEELFREGRLIRIQNDADIAKLDLRKKPSRTARVNTTVKNQVLDLILDGWNFNQKGA